ncbi:AraC family transcriptional regulator [Paraflavitalea sp. CAU 1676]|uniref:helix-turn-helix domain-containing protein n=1 Tax=Paraflavitalea sp. CAU 1676 TaxID=3032598 RepID=UPI0023DBCCF0|nr:AraC family transcriptional regulator [Paraflavitalea sp. CAU 1676]MDF2193394.1 AraC family transcriptional regulator [Paraflavitalea sp. CAU 1676]
MDIATFYPGHKTLKAHIDYYYFLKADSPDFQTTYYAFPNIAVPLSIHRSATCEITDACTQVQALKQGQSIALVQRTFQQPLLVKLQGPIDKVTICFKPSGFSYFIPQPFSIIAPDDSQLFTAWEGIPGYQAFLDRFFGTDDNHERVEHLESWLLAQYRHDPAYEMMGQAIAWLSDFDNPCTIDEVAERLALTIRSFNRLFLKHMNISPVAWKKIARFRHSLKNKLFNAQFRKLTEIGYGSNFYDQSYFIKVYNKLTGSNPGAFFKSVEKLADDHLIFRFVKE